jgi:hypothetical protein
LSQFGDDKMDIICRVKKQGMMNIWYGDMVKLKMPNLNIQGIRLIPEYQTETANQMRCYIL